MGGCFLARRYRRGLVVRFLQRRLGLTGLDDAALSEAYVRRVRDQLDAGHGPDAVVLLPFDGRYGSDGKLDRDTTSFFVSNDYCLDACRRDPRLLPAASVNPKRRDALDELTRVAELGAVCVKTVPNSQDFDPANPAYRPFYRRMADLGLPWLTHTGHEHTIPVTRQTYGDPSRLSLALEAGVTVIAAHAGTAGPFTLRETFPQLAVLARRHDNLFADISALGTASRFRLYGRVLRCEALNGRLVYGSDYPVPSSPLLLAPRLGPSTAWRIARSGDDLSRPLEIARGMGVPDAALRSAGSLLRVEQGLISGIGG